MNLLNIKSLLTKALVGFFILLGYVNIHAEIEIRGVVIDSETNKAIPNVIIEINEIEKTITTSSEGIFSLKLTENSELDFIINHIGYNENIVHLHFDEKSSDFLAFYLIPKTIELDAVLISDYKSYSKFDDIQEISNVLKGKELDKHLSITLASTLKNEAGLAIRSMGPAPSRPVIRGLGSNRVLISEDGIKTTDLSSTSPDHAVTIDPFNVSRVEVLRGPKILTQSSTTIGGIVNVVRNEIPTMVHNNLQGQIGFLGESVNKGYIGSLMLEIPISALAIKGEVSKRQTQNLLTPIGKLKNSESNNYNYSLASSYVFDNGFIGASFRRFELDYGVPGGFVGAHPNGVDIAINKNQYNLKSKLKFNTSIIDDIDLNLSRVFYRHKEFESKGQIGSEFKIVNYLGSLNFNNNKFLIFQKGILGTSFEYRDFDIGGFVFTTPSKSLNISTYLFEEFSINKFKYQVGARYNFDKVTPIEDNLTSKIGEIRERIFNTYSLSLSVLWEQSEHVFFGLNINKSSRIPTIEELFSEGPHLAAYSYEVGNPGLMDEKGFGSELFIHHHFKSLFFNLNVFRNELSNYIIPRNSGLINYATILPIYNSVGVKALFWGFDGKVEWDFVNNFKLINTLSYTKGKIKNGGSLPQIPPLKGLMELRYYSSKFNLGVSGEWAMSQKLVDEFEDPTKGYFVFNIFTQYSIVNLKNTISINFIVNNLFNKEYRNHLSRIKSILPEEGRNFKLSTKMYFHL